MNDRRRGLRAATSEKHRHLDALIGRFADRRGYQTYLRSSLSFRAAAEPALSGAGARTLGIAPVDLVAPLILDCGDLGVVPDPAPLPPVALHDLSATIGALYVLEGSALGAAVLRRDAQALGYDAGFGGRHFSLQIGAPGRWAAFLAVLDEIEAFDPGAAISGANHIFDLAILAAEAACAEYEC